MEKKVSFPDLYALGIGFTIVFCMLPTIIAGAVVPRSGVSYSLSKEAFSSNAAGAIFGGACLAVTTTINSAFSWYSQACIRAAEDGWFPNVLAKENKYGTPYLIQFIFVLFGAVPVLLVSDIAVLNVNLLKVAAGLQILCSVIPNLGLLSLPRLYPEQWAKSRYARSHRRDPGDGVLQLLNLSERSVVPGFEHLRVRLGLRGRRGRDDQNTRAGCRGKGGAVGMNVRRLSMSHL